MQIWEMDGKQVKAPKIATAMKKLLKRDNLHGLMPFFFEDSYGRTCRVEIVMEDNTRKQMFRIS